VAGDGEEALRRVADASTELGEVFSPDLIVLDVMIPRLDGREVCHHLRVAGNWTPVIMLTQVGSSAERAMSLEEGADDYLNKPFDPYELVARIRAVLHRARPGVKWKAISFSKIRALRETARFFAARLEGMDCIVTFFRPGEGPGARGALKGARKIYGCTIQPIMI
jgi:DNA-binding response OmpR family regulator